MLSPGQTIQFSLILRNPSTFAAQNIDANTTLSGKVIVNSVISNLTITVSSDAVQAGKYNLTFTVPANQTNQSVIQIMATATVANQTETAVVFEDYVQTGLSAMGDDYAHGEVEFLLQPDDIAQIWNYANRTLTSFGTLVSDTALAMWGAAERTLTDFGFTVSTNDSANISAIKTQTDKLAFDGDNNVWSAPKTSVDVVSLAGNDLRDGSRAGQGLAQFGADYGQSVAFPMPVQVGGNAPGWYTAPNNAAAANAANNTASLPAMIDDGKFTVFALSNAPTGFGGAGTVNITVTPTTATVSAGEVIGSAIVAYENAAANFVFAVVDGNGTAIDLTGKTVQFVATDVCDISTPIITRDNDANGGLSVGGADNNTVTVALTSAHTATIRTLRYALWNVTDSTPLATGLFEIRAIPQEAS